MIFFDTSAIYALADAGDARHRQAVAILRALARAGETFLLHSYVVIEAAVLLQNRLGPKEALAFLGDADRHEVEWIGPDVHRAAVEELKKHERRAVSLVDCASFVVMRRRHVRAAFAFDDHFRGQGFDLAGSATGEPGA